MILRSLIYNIVVIPYFMYHQQAITGGHIPFPAKYCHLGFLRAKKLILAPLKFAQISIHMYIPGKVFSSMLYMKHQTSIKPNKSKYYL